MQGKHPAHFYLVLVLISILKTGLEQLFNQLTRPRLRPILDEAYRDVNYVLDDDAFQEAEELDPVRKRFVKSWDSLILGYRVSFSDI